MKFLLDANFLLTSIKFKVDIFSELMKFGKPELYTLDLILKELKKVSEGKGKDAKNAKLALTILERKNVKTLKTKNKSADQEIERIAAEQNLTVCTQDRALIEKLRAEELDIVIIRQKKYLEKI